jgi:hypothetical protein
LTLQNESSSCGNSKMRRELVSLIRIAHTHITDTQIMEEIERNRCEKNDNYISKKIINKTLVILSVAATLVFH